MTIECTHNDNYYPKVYDYLCDKCGRNIPLPYRMDEHKMHHLKFKQWWAIHKNHKQYCQHCRKHVKVNQILRGGY
jgi:hypothetical protein